MIQEGFPTHEWITRLADDERRRDAVTAAERGAGDGARALRITSGRLRTS